MTQGFYLIFAKNSIIVIKRPLCTLIALPHTASFLIFYKNSLKLAALSAILLITRFRFLSLIISFLIREQAELATNPLHQISIGRTISTYHVCLLLQTTSIFSYQRPLEASQVYSKLSVSSFSNWPVVLPHVYQCAALPSVTNKPFPASFPSKLLLIILISAAGKSLTLHLKECPEINKHDGSLSAQLFNFSSKNLILPSSFSHLSFQESCFSQSLYPLTLCHLRNHFLHLAASLCFLISSTSSFLW